MNYKSIRGIIITHSPYDIYNEHIHVGVDGNECVDELA